MRISRLCKLVEGGDCGSRDTVSCYVKNYAGIENSCNSVTLYLLTWPPIWLHPLSYRQVLTGKCRNVSVRSHGTYSILSLLVCRTVCARLEDCPIAQRCDHNYFYIHRIITILIPEVFYRPLPLACLIKTHHFSIILDELETLSSLDINAIC